MKHYIILIILLFSNLTFASSDPVKEVEQMLDTMGLSYTQKEEILAEVAAADDKAATANMLKITAPAFFGATFVDEKANFMQLYTDIKTSTGFALEFTVKGISDNKIANKLGKMLNLMQADRYKGDMEPALVVTIELTSNSQGLWLKKSDFNIDLEITKQTIKPTKEAELYFLQDDIKNAIMAFYNDLPIQKYTNFEEVEPVLYASMSRLVTSIQNGAGARFRDNMKKQEEEMNAEKNPQDSDLENNLADYSELADITILLLEESKIFCNKQPTSKLKTTATGGYKFCEYSFNNPSLIYYFEPHSKDVHQWRAVKDNTAYQIIENKIFTHSQYYFKQEKTENWHNFLPQKGITPGEAFAQMYADVFTYIAFAMATAGVGEFAGDACGALLDGIKAANGDPTLITKRSIESLLTSRLLGKGLKLTVNLSSKCIVGIKTIVAKSKKTIKINDSQNILDNIISKKKNSTLENPNNVDEYVDIKLQGAGRQPWNGFANIFKANADEILEAANRIKNHRTTSGNLSGGNYGYLEGTVNNTSIDNKMWRSGTALADEPKIFTAIEVEGAGGKTWLRTTDSEYKMLNKLASDLGGTTGSVKPNVIGEFKIVSENPYCASCSGIIQQFNQMFPNVKLILVDGAK